MKKILSAIAFTAIIAVSCSKELNKDVEKTIPEGKGNIVRISASYIDDGLKTAYANEKTFSWVKDDIIRVLCSDGSSNSFANFIAEDSGASATFTAELNDGYRPSDLAFYPNSLNPSVNAQGIYTVTTSSNGYFSAPGKDPLSGLPLIGVPNGTGDSYSFSSAAGMLKFTFNNIPDDAYWFTLYTNATNQPLYGKFTVDDNNVISLDNYVSGGGTMYYTVINADQSGTFTAYVPVPVGTVKAGLTIAIEDSSDRTLYEIETKQDIVVKRNTITEVRAIDIPVEEFDYLGTGMYNDYSFLGLYNYYVDVEIYRSKSEPNKYKIIDPYSAIHDQLGSTPAAGMLGPDAVLIVTVLNNGDAINNSINADEDGYVIWEKYYTGFDDYGDEVQMLHPLTPYHWNSYTNAEARYSRVLKYNSQGGPAVIQLAPLYLDYYAAGGAWYTFYNGIKNQTVQIVFPGETPIDSSFDYTPGSITNDNPSSPEYTFSIDRIGNSAQQVKVAYSTISADDALANIASGQTVASAGNVVIDLPANLPSGNVYIAIASYYDNELWINESFKFDWFNSDFTKGYTIDDLVGTYDVYAYEYDSGWIDSYFFMVFEASDIPDKGNVMITSIETADGMVFSNTQGSIYADFDTDTGLITIAPNQPFSSYYSYGIRIKYYYDSSANIVLDLTAPGEFVVHDAGDFFELAAFSGNSYVGFFYLYDTSTLYAERENPSPTPAPAPNSARKQSGSPNVSRELSTKQNAHAFQIIAIPESPIKKVATRR